MMDSSAEVIALAQRGSLEAFTQLVREHHTRVRAFLSQYIRHWDEVDDLAQECFLAAHQGIERFEGNVPFGAWLIGIARNKLLMHLRSKGRSQQQKGESLWRVLAERWAARVENDSDRLSGEDFDSEMRALKACLQSLPMASAALIEKHYFEGKRVVEIAREEGKKERAVGMTLLRIRKALRQCVGRKLSALGVPT